MLEELSGSSDHDCAVGASRISRHPLSTTLYPAVYQVPPHAPLSTAPCAMLRFCPAHLRTLCPAHPYLALGGGCLLLGRGGENPTETCTYLRTGPGSRHGHGA